MRYLMEEMVPELEELEKKGYFTRKEVKQIVQRRQEFEYQLKRRAALKQDFYRYIEYETKLEDLRQLRKKKLGIKGEPALQHTAFRTNRHQQLLGFCSSWVSMRPCILLNTTVHCMAA